MSSHFVVSTGYEPKLACRTSATSGNKWLNGGDSTLPNQACFRAEQEQEQEKRERKFVSPATTSTEDSVRCKGGWKQCFTSM